MGKGSKQATRREGRRYTPRIPATGPPRLTTCTCMRSPGVAYRTHKIKNWKSRPTRTSSVHVFQLGGAGGRVLISRDDDWRLLFFSFNYSPLSVPLVRWLAG